MKWYSVKKYRVTSNCGECFVIAREYDTYVATFQYHEELDDYAWVGEEGNVLDDVTHFAIPDPIEIEE